MGERIAKCRSCGALIFWARTSSGKSMPIDAMPTSDGNIELGTDPGTMETTAHVRDGSWPEGLTGERYTSHFATCPQAAQHRRAG